MVASRKAPAAFAVAGLILVALALSTLRTPSVLSAAVLLAVPGLLLLYGYVRGLSGAARHPDVQHLLLVLRDRLQAEPFDPVAPPPPAAR